MPTSDTLGPRRMTWEEFEERAIAAIRKATAGRGVVSDGLRFCELPALFGDDLGPRLALALSSPPCICPRCDALFRSALPRTACPDCEAKDRMRQAEAAIRADERRKTIAELTQGGSTT